MKTQNENQTPFAKFYVNVAEYNTRLQDIANASYKSRRQRKEERMNKRAAHQLQLEKVKLKAQQFFDFTVTQEEDTSKIPF